MFDDEVTREIRRAWAESPARVIGATVATVLAVPLIRLVYIVAVETLHALGVPK